MSCTVLFDLLQPVAGSTNPSRQEPAKKKRLLQMRTPSGSGSLSAADARFLGIHHDELKLGHLELDPLLSEFTFDQKSSGHIIYTLYFYAYQICFFFYCIIIYIYMI